MMKKYDITEYVFMTIIGILMFSLLWVVTLAVTCTNETVFLALSTAGVIGIVSFNVWFQFKRFIDDVEFYEIMYGTRKES